MGIFKFFFPSPKYYEQFVRDSNCIGAARVAECLRSLSIERIVEVQENIAVIPVPKPIHYLLPFMPTFGLPEVPFHPYLAFKTENFLPLPLLVGSNREDGRPFIYAAMDFPLDVEAYDLALLGLFGLKELQVGSHSLPHSLSLCLPLSLPLLTDASALKPSLLPLIHSSSDRLIHRSIRWGRCTTTRHRYRTTGTPLCRS